MYTTPNVYCVYVDKDTLVIGSLPPLPTIGFSADAVSQPKPNGKSVTTVLFEQSNSHVGSIPEIKSWGSHKPQLKQRNRIACRQGVMTYPQ